MFMMKHVDRSNCHTFVSNTVIWWKQKYMVAQTFDVSNRSQAPTLFKVWVSEFMRSQTFQFYTRCYPEVFRQLL